MTLAFDDDLGGPLPFRKQTPNENAVVTRATTASAV
jgi:hypothetical protein